MKERTKCEIPKIKNKWLHKGHKRWYVTLDNGERISYARYKSWEKEGIKPIEPYCVHHINKNTLDDRNINLKIVSRSEHRKIHNKGNKYGSYPKTEEHRKKISKANEFYPVSYLIKIYNKKKPISKRKFCKVVGYKRASVFSNKKRFNGGWTNFKKKAELSEGARLI